MELKMSIIRIKKEREYVSIANAILQDKTLSWEARGIMAYLLSKPDGWECRNYDLVNQGPAGKHIVQRVLKELQKTGYIHRYQKSDGHKIEWVTEIYETPDLNTTSRNTDILPTDEPAGGKPVGRESGDIVNTDSQKVLIPKSTDFSGNSQKSKLTQSEKDELNILAAHIAKATNTNANDEDSKDRLKAATLLGYEIAKICGLIISIIDHADQRMIEQLIKVTISLYQNNVTVGDLEKFKIWWYDNTWRGKKGQTPSPAQIASYWGQFEAAQSIPTSPAGPALSEVARENYKRLLAQQTK
jgi:hypothetical protein